VKWNYIKENVFFSLGCFEDKNVALPTPCNAFYSSLPVFRTIEKLYVKVTQDILHDNKYCTCIWICRNVLYTPRGSL